MRSPLVSLSFQTYWNGLLGSYAGDAVLSTTCAFLAGALEEGAVFCTGSYTGCAAWGEAYCCSALTFGVVRKSIALILLSSACLRTSLLRIWPLGPVAVI